MAATLYSDILKKANQTGQKYGDVALRDWFRDKAMDVVGNIDSGRVLNRAGAKANVVAHPRMGRMLMYRYDPKHKLTLPYYDKFPLIFPIEKYKDGFLGINMHYLPPIFRARLMDALYDTLNNQKYDDTTKMKISYQILKNASKFRYFQPTIHRYLTSHIRSPLVEIDIKEWDYVLMLPLAKFAKMNQRAVWDESVKMITK